MPEEKKSEVTEEVKEARKLSMEELEQVTGGSDSDESGTDNPLLVSDKAWIRGDLTGTFSVTKRGASEY